MSAHHPRLARIERILRDQALKLLERENTIAEVAAALAAAVAGEAPADLTPRERKAKARRVLREKILAELGPLEAKGQGRAAPMLLAKKFARDPRDPVEVESLARNIRNWRREKFGNIPFADSRKD
jgi:hypothetical protein